MRPVGVWKAWPVFYRGGCGMDTRLAVTRKRAAPMF